MTSGSPDLSGKVALVTGGSRGLGRQMCLAFAEAGADVIVTSRDSQACTKVAEEVQQRGRQALAVSCHVGRWEEIGLLVEHSYEAFGQVDILVNNAGKSPLYMDLADISEAHFDSVLNVNLKGPFRLGVLVGQRMRDAGGGVIINVSSTCSLRADPQALPYSAAKAGLNALTVGLAQALAPSVRVNALVLGAFATDISEHWTAEVRGRLEAASALNRVAEPSEIIGAALFLASCTSSYVTGSLLTVDGGMR